MAICRKATVNDLRVDVSCTHLDPEYVLNNNGTHVWWAEEKKKKRLMPNSSLKVISRQEGYKTDDKGNFVKAIDNVQPVIIIW